MPVLRFKAFGFLSYRNISQRKLVTGDCLHIFAAVQAGFGRQPNLPYAEAQAAVCPLYHGFISSFRQESARPALPNSWTIKPVCFRQAVFNELDHNSAARIRPVIRGIIIIAALLLLRHHACRYGFRCRRAANGQGSETKRAACRSEAGPAARAAESRTCRCPGFIFCRPGFFKAACSTI